jgi:DHA2 family multidrug resistance protein
VKEKTTKVKTNKNQEDPHLAALEANKGVRWLILIGLVVSAILEVMDTSILNVALPQMAGSLSVTVQDIAWVSTAYLLANVVVLPMTAWLAQRFGRKNYLIASIILFTVSRALCAVCPSLGLVIICRLVQGAAGAALISTSQAVLVDIFPAKQQAPVQAVFGMGLVVAPAVAPLLGGWIVDNYGWQPMFYIHIPIALMSLGIVISLYKDGSTSKSRQGAGRLDSIGVGLLAIGLGSLQYVLEEGQRDDWFNDSGIVRLSFLAVAGIVALVIWELSPKNQSPVVNFRVYGNGGLSAAVLISFAMGIGLYGVNFAFAVLVQNILGFTSVKSGLALLPMGAGAMLGLIVVAGASNKVNPRLLITVGLCLSAIGTWMLGFNTQTTGIEDTLLPLGVVGLGLGSSMVPVTVSAFAALRPAEAADGSAQLGLGRQLGGSFGIALINTYIVNMTGFHRANLLGYLDRTNTMLTSTISGLAGSFVQHGRSFHEAERMALGTIDQLVSLQAIIKGYNSGFQLVAIVFIGCLLLVPLLKVPKDSGRAAPAVH